MAKHRAYQPGDLVRILNKGKRVSGANPQGTYLGPSPFDPQRAVVRLHKGPRVCVPMGRLFLARAVAHRG